MDYRFMCALCWCLQLALLPLRVLSQGDLSLSDALDGNDNKPSTTTIKPRVVPGGTGGDCYNREQSQGGDVRPETSSRDNDAGSSEILSLAWSKRGFFCYGHRLYSFKEFSLEDLFNVGSTTTTTKAPTKVGPKVPTKTKDSAKPKPAADDLDLADALDPKKDIGFRDKNKGQEGAFSDSDLTDVSKDNTYKPDKGKGGRLSDDGRQINQQDDNSETTAEVGTIAGIVSAVAMALVGAVTSYISYQKKKLCFSIQQSLRGDMTNAENSEPGAATKPQVQQTLLEPPNAPTEVNVV